MIAKGPVQVNVQVRCPAGKATIPALAVNSASAPLDEVCNFFVLTLSAGSVTATVS